MVERVPSMGWDNVDEAVLALRGRYLGHHLQEVGELFGCMIHVEIDKEGGLVCLGGDQVLNGLDVLLVVEGVLVVVSDQCEGVLRPVELLLDQSSEVCLADCPDAQRDVDDHILAPDGPVITPLNIRKSTFKLQVQDQRLTHLEILVGTV